MMRAKNKTRDAREARFAKRGKIGIPELEGYYFGHGDERSGTRFNRAVEKLADYARIEYGMDMFYLILEGTEPTWEEIPIPSGKGSAALMKKYEIDYKYQKDEKREHQKNKEKMFGIVLGQCKDGTKDLVKADKAFASLQKKGDVIGLINTIRDLSYGTDRKTYVGWTQQAQLRKTVNFMQQDGESVQKFSVNFLEQVKAFEDAFGPMIPTKEMYKVIEMTRTVRDGDEECDETYEETVLASESEILDARNKFIACLFLAGVDRKRYKDAIDEMNNDYLRHGKEYPTTVQAMVVWLTKRRGGTSKSKQDDASDGVTSFAQIDRVECWHCHEKGHFNWDCPTATSKQREEYKQLSISRSQARSQNDDSSVGSRDSVSSAGSSSGSSKGSASGNVRSNGRRPSTPRRKPRRGVFEMSNFAFGIDG